jgi:hypothetical protein
MVRRAVNILSQVKIALAVTVVAATLQALYNPGKAVILGPPGAEQTIYLSFGLFKVFGFLTLSLLGARALYLQQTERNNLRKADLFLFAMLIGTLLLAVCVLAGMKVIQSEAFIERWGVGTPQSVAAATMFALFFMASIPFYRRQYYDISAIMNVKNSELALIRGNLQENRRFLNTATKKFSLLFLPLFCAHIVILKTSADSNLRIAASLADGLVTCAMALALAYAIAAAQRVTAKDAKKRAC